MFQVTATIKNTSLDGSLVQLLVDSRAVASKRFWARGEHPRDVCFQIWLETVGNHLLEIGRQSLGVSVVG
jgi:hypothetical protein